MAMKKLALLICFLSIDMSPSMVDFNVHPTKIEVRFVDSQQLYRQLLAMLRTKFLTMNLDSVLRVSEKAEAAAVGSGATPAVREMQSELSDWVDQQVSLAVESDDADADGVQPAQGFGQLRLTFAGH